MKPQLRIVFIGRCASGPSERASRGVCEICRRQYTRSSGLPANFLVADLPVTRADLLSFSDSGGRWSRNGEIDLVDANAQPVASFAIREAAPLLNVDGALTTAIAWLPSSHSILYWDGKAFAHTETNFDGEITVSNHRAR